MRSVKPLSSTAVATAFATVLLAAGSASADSLCKEAPDGTGTCPAGKAYGVPTLIEATTAETKFSAGAIAVKCESTLKAETTKNLGENMGLDGELTELLFSECTVCEHVIAQGMLYKAVTTGVAGGTGRLTLSTGQGGGIPRIEFINCAGITCLYGSSSIVLRYKPSTTATTAAHIEIVSAAPQTLTKQMGSDAPCPASGKWETTDYTIGAPLPLWVTKFP